MLWIEWDSSLVEALSRRLALSVLGIRGLAVGDRIVLLGEGFMSDSLRILWLKTGPLHPLDTGGKLRTYHLLRELNRRHDVTYFALKEPGMGLSDPVLTAANEYSSHQQWFDWNEVSKQSGLFYWDLFKNFCFSRLPYVIDKYRSQAMADAIEKIDRAAEVDVIICDFLTPAVNLFSNPQGDLKTPALLFQHNVEAQIWKRMAEQSGNGLKRRYLLDQWRRMQTYEAASAAQMDSVVGVSKVDCDQMEEEYQLSNVLGEVPTGVDVDYFRADNRKKVTNQIVFLGSMDWLPNIDSVEYFVQEIWPLVRRERSDVEFVIVGRRPTASVRRLAEADVSIKVTGTVADVRPHVAEAAAVVVPLRVGGGTRIKIFEAMSMGVPVISTSIGAEGLDVTHGENILLADDSRGFADAILDLFRDQDRAERVGQAAAAHVRALYSWEVVAQEFEKFCYFTTRRRREEASVASESVE